jgi:NADH dehydrogenase
MNAHQRKHLLILGGGFGGLYAAIELERALAYQPDVEITLVNRENFFLFTPMLHEIAASDLDITHIVNPIRKVLRQVTFLHGEVESIDLARKRAAVFHGPNQHHHELSYDYLVPTCINQSNNVSFAAGVLLPWSIRRVPRSDSSWQRKLRLPR